MRTFIAFPLPLEIKESIAETQDKLKDCHLDAKWVEPTNLHITLKFLGEIQEAVVSKVKEILENIGTNFSSVNVNLKEFGFFPNEKKPRVFFISTDQEDYLRSISLTLEEKLEEIGFKKEERFKSHITIARFRSKKNLDCLFRRIKNIKIERSFFIREIVFFKSILTSRGPIYEEIFKINLKT
ncbi:MAG: RNA 2',3'-cyclic phosphodiesterase [Candidatus Omnitrophota bacterium]|nr:MAG: RNA 2',3'-cyclic phosphodiesterase [Candidatus Omnitrophota bacterium]